MFFLFPERSTIRLLKFQKTIHLRSVIADLNGAVGLTYYANTGYLYWSDMKENCISRYKKVLTIYTQMFFGELVLFFTRN